MNIIKISEKYQDTDTGITAEVVFDNGKKIVELRDKNNRQEFIFNKSSLATINKIGQSFLNLADYLDKL